jgi:hypothetical protein
MPKKKFFCILKRYDNIKRENNYYIALSNIEDSSHIWGVVQSNSNYTKYDLKDIWNTLPVHNYTGVTEVNIEEKSPYVTNKKSKFVKVIK